MSTDEISNRRCTWLLNQRGFRYWREADIGQILTLRGTNPDFLVETPVPVRFFLELKSFEQDTLLDRFDPSVRTFSVGIMSLQKRANRLVRDAAEQLLPYADSGHPMIIVLDNYRQKGISLDHHTLGGLFGELQVQIRINPTTGENLGEAWVRSDDGSPLAGGRNQHVSAVAALIAGERFDTFEEVDDFSIERKMKVRILYNPDATFSPDYGTCPGTTLREVLDNLGLSQSDLAERTGRPKKTINEIVQGKTAITPETALQLERVLSIPASFWNNLERSYRAAQARDDERARLAEYLPWLDTFPLKELTKRGWIRPHEDRIELVREVLTFFGVAFPDAWNEVWAEARKATALRQAKSPRVDFGAVTVWLRKGEMDGRARRCAPYDSDRFREALIYLRGLTAMAPDIFCAEMQTRCAAAGVAVAFVRELPRLRIFGAARWLSSDKALLQLSLYYKREDQLWFSFFHEAAHILLHGRRDVFVDLDASAMNKQEDEANRFASDHLVPAHAYARFLTRGNFSGSAVLQFAKQIGIAPGIIVGRLQHDKQIGFNHLNHLRRRVDWSTRTGPDGIG